MTIQQVSGAPRFGQLVTNIPEIRKSAENPVIQRALHELEQDFGNLHIGKNEQDLFYFYWSKIATFRRTALKADMDPNALLGVALAEPGRKAASLLRYVKESIDKTIRQFNEAIQDNRLRYRLVDTWMAQERPQGRLDILNRVVPWLKTLQTELNR